MSWVSDVSTRNVQGKGKCLGAFRSEDNLIVIFGNGAIDRFKVVNDRVEYYLNVQVSVPCQ